MDTFPISLYIATPVTSNYWYQKENFLGPNCDSKILGVDCILVLALQEVIYVVELSAEKYRNVLKYWDT